MRDLRRTLTLKCKSTGDMFTFPITPFPKFTESVSYDTVNIYGNGEMVTGHNRQLTRCSIDGIFPGKPTIDANEQKILETLGDEDATIEGTTYYCKLLSKWLNNQNNLELSYRTKKYPVQTLDCRIESFECGEEDGSMNMHFNLNLIEYRVNTIKDNSIAKKIDNIIEQYGSSVYYTEEGDTLITIAGKIFSDSSQWYYLQNINNLENPLKVFSNGEKIILKR